MNKDVLRKWVDALRSGEFEQTKGRLSKIENDGSRTFCCLGVLCELAKEDGVVNHVDLIPVSPHANSSKDYQGDFSYDGNEALPPTSVEEYIGEVGFDWDVFPLEDIFDAEGDLLFNASERAGLAELNDEGNLTFEQIADAIEAQYLSGDAS